METDTIGRFVFLKRGGHRENWAKFLEKKFAVNVYFGYDFRSDITYRSHLVFLFAEEDLFYIFLVSWLRYARGRRTKLVMLNAERAVHPSNSRRTIFSWAVRVFKKIRVSEILTIMPYEIEPGLKKYTHGHLPDINFIDLDFMPQDQRSAERVPVGKKRLTALGYLTAERGIDVLLSAFNESSAVREFYDVTVAGKLGTHDEAALLRFKSLGGNVIERWISEEEMDGMLRGSHILFCLFHPHYDQSSGVFGHSLQVGSLPLVRSGSRLHMMQNKIYEFECSCSYDPSSLASFLIENAYDRRGLSDRTRAKIEELRETGIKAWEEIIFDNKMPSNFK